MDNIRLTEYLDEYIKMDKPQFAVMITGEWGCGKTHYILSCIKKWSNSKIKVDTNSIQLKPIYVSVNGLSSVGSIIRKIKIVLFPALYSKGAKVAEKIILSVFQVVTKAKLDLDADGAGEDLNSLLDAEGILEIFKSESSSIKGNKVLILDDIERCRIPLDELFGFVNEIVEHSNSKVILICDEAKLISVTDKDNLKIAYKDFKEKLVGQTFALSVDYRSLTESFLDSTGNAILVGNRNLIIDLIIASQCVNLRLIRHSLFDIVRFFDQLPKEIQKSPNYPEFVSNVVAYLVITSLEVCSGGSEIESFQSYHFSGETEKASLVLRKKYNPVLEQHQIYNSAYSIPIKYLISYIHNGFLETSDSIISGCRILQSRNLSDWEKLWRCDDLSNEDFIALVKKEKNRFYKKQLEFVFEVVHLSGILLSLEKRSLVKLSRSNIVRTAKETVRRIIECYPGDKVRTSINSKGYEFHEAETLEMKDIISYVNDLLQSKNNQIKKEYVQSIWRGLGPDFTRRDLETALNVVTPFGNCTYDMEEVFTQVSPKYMASLIVSLPNSGRIEFTSYLVGRYYLRGAGVHGTIREEMKKDKESLAEIALLLKKKAKRLKLIDKETTLLVASKIDEAVEKM